jgi:hypothetical protein
MVLQPGESFTCLAHFIPDIPGVVPESLIFAQPPEWTDTYPFDHVTAGWDTALADGGKTAYLFGPRITNNEDPNYLFSYKLYYQWDGGATDYDPNYPIYLDWVIFNDSTLIRDLGWRRRADGTWEGPNEVTWDGPYENPVPEPMTICLLTLGAAFLRKRRPSKNS